MARSGAAEARDKNTTLAVSPEFAEMVNDLARARGVTVRAFCDRHLAAKCRPEWKAVVAAKLKRIAGDAAKGGE